MLLGLGRTLSLPNLPSREDSPDSWSEPAPRKPGPPQHSLGAHWEELSSEDPSPSSSPARAKLTVSQSLPNPSTAAGPDHLLMLVSGIFSTKKDWNYVGGQLRKRLGNRVLVHASDSNRLTKTFHGIDVAGKRLADEVRGLVKKNPSLTKISFVGHSLGGLLCRYCIAMLYEPPEGGPPSEEVPWPKRGRIGGLLPVDFITLATPHLGVRGNKQLPILAGVQPLEKLTARMAPLAIGRTGGQLFLTDTHSNEPPLLLRMSRDCEEALFVSALRSFQLRVAYANAGYDHTVGWRTACIRGDKDLPVIPKTSVSPQYKYVVAVEECLAVSLGGRGVISRTVSGGSIDGADSNVWGHVWGGIGERCDRLEEEMVAGLGQVSWRKVDVCFRGAYMAYMAHHNIQVQHPSIHKAGAGVVAHLADTLLRQEQHFTSDKVLQDAAEGTVTHVEGKPVEGGVLAGLKKKRSGRWGFTRPPKHGAGVKRGSKKGSPEVDQVYLLETKARSQSPEGSCETEDQAEVEEKSGVVSAQKEGEVKSSTAVGRVWQMIVGESSELRKGT